MTSPATTTPATAPASEETPDGLALPAGAEEFLVARAAEDFCGVLHFFAGDSIVAMLGVKIGDTAVESSATGTRVGCGWKGQVSGTNLAGDPTTWDYLNVVVTDSSSLWDNFPLVVDPPPEEFMDPSGIQRLLVGLEPNGLGVLARVPPPYVMQVHCACTVVEPTNRDLLGLVGSVLTAPR